MSWVKGAAAGFVERVEKPVIVVGGERWYGFEVYAGCEKYFADKLGEGIYYPQKVVWKKKRKSNRKSGPARERTLVPYFAGYLFFNGSIEQDAFKWVYDDRKFLGILSNGPVAAIVPASEIARLKAAESSGSYDETRKVFSNIIGATVEVVSGIFAGRLVFIESVDNKNASGHLIGSPLPVKISLSELEKIGQ